MSARSSLSAVQAFGDAINTNDTDAFDDLVSPECVDHDPAPGQERGPAGYKKFFGDMRIAFPDLHVEVEQLVADGDNVAMAYTLTGTNTGPVMGHEPTGRSVEIRGLQISRFDNGKMVERWGSTDQLGMFTQLAIEKP